MVEVALVKLGQSLAHVKIWGVQHPLGTKIWCSKKGTVGGYNFTSTSSRLLDQSSRKPVRSSTCPILNIFIHSADIRR